MGLLNANEERLAEESQRRPVWITAADAIFGAGACTAGVRNFERHTLLSHCVVVDSRRAVNALLARGNVKGIYAMYLLKTIRHVRRRPLLRAYNWILAWRVRRYQTGR